MPVWADKIKEQFYKDSERWFLWAPVLFGLGIGFYFLLPREPSIWLTLGVIESLIAAAVIARRRLGILLGLAIAAIVVLGFADVQLKAVYLAKTPLLQENIDKIYLRGRIVSLDYNSRGNQRVVLDNLENFDEQRLNWGKIKVSLSHGTEPLHSGQCIELVGKIMPLPAPSLPGGYQFDRKSFFEGLTASGYSISRALPVDCRNEPSWADKFGYWVDRVRQRIVARIDKVLPADEAGITAAIVAGERGGMSRRLVDNYRDSGLAHFLSISGLHMSMLAGLMFFLVRFVMALVPGLALRRDSKKPAAVLALFMSVVYLLISGAQIPTQRAFIMTFIVLLGVLFARRAISMKTIAWAGLIVLIIAPEALVGASFQMSFAAVMALIAFYEKYAGALQRFLRGSSVDEPSLPVKILKIIWIYVAGIIVSDLIASLATLPFAIYHFNRVVLYTSLANLLAGPIIGLIIMPFVLIALLLMPLGLEAWALKLVGFGVGAVNDITAWVASLPQAALQVPSLPTWGLILIVLGGLWLFIWLQPWRKWGFLLIAAGFLSLLTVRCPDVLVNDKGNLVAVRDNFGELVILPARGNNFDKKVWLEKTANQKITAKETRRLKKIYQGKENFPEWLDLQCDEQSCLYKRRVKIIKSGGLEVDGKSLDLSAGLGAAVYFNGEEASIQTVRDASGYRLWNFVKKGL